MRVVLNREIIDGEPGNDSYNILKFWPTLSLEILIKRILIKKSVCSQFYLSKTCALYLLQAWAWATLC